MQDARFRYAKHSTAPLLLTLLALATLMTGCASTDEQQSQLSAVRNYAWVSAEPQAAEKTSGDDIEPTVVAFRDYQDPLIGFNRAIFRFNDVSYRYVLMPAGRGYNKVVPQPVRNSVSNFFYNLQSPIYFINNALQLEPRDAGVTLLRFGINSTLGLLGLFDPATQWFDIDTADTGFADTFAHYGVGYGVYLVLPLLGPSDLRDGTSSLIEGFFHPISYIAENPERIVIQGFDYFQEFAPQADLYEKLADQSEDPYIFFRNLYLQGVQRDAAYE